MLFGYACHPTTLSWNTWCGDYPGFAQVNLEANHPGAAAMFFNACGADQNPIPRRKVELCERYGKMLSDAVEEVLSRPMQRLSGGLRSAFEFVDLPYEETGYWRDVGTVGAFFDANMDLLGKEPRFDLLNKLWPIHAPGHDSPAAKILGGEVEPLRQ